MLEGFDSVISLGGNCEVAHHIRRLGRDRANIFDWWITPFGAVISLLENRFDGLFVPQNMQFVGDRHAVRCSRYGIIHHHDFERDEDALVVADRIEAQLDTLREKYSVLARSFFERCDGKRVLFIRSWLDVLHAPPSYPEHLPPGSQDYPFDQLMHSLQEAVPTADFRILFLNYGEQSFEHPRALFHDVENKGDRQDWTGSVGGWDETFAQVDRIPLG